jgi:hypothetical protein
MHNQNEWFPSALNAWDWDTFVVDARALFSRWRALTASEAPWTEMAADDAAGCMRSVISELVNEAHEPCDGSHDWRLLLAAFEHGRFRRLQGCSSAILTREFDALRTGLRAVLGDTLISPSVVADALVVLEPELVAAGEAAMAGWEGMCQRPQGADS